MAPGCYLIFKIMNFYWLIRSGRPRRITVPNFVKIGRSIAVLLHFLFLRMVVATILIIKIAKFYWQTGSGGPRCITPSSMKIIEKSDL